MKTILINVNNIHGLSTFYGESISGSTQLITLDFRETTFVDPTTLTVVAALCIDSYQNGKNVTVAMPKNTNVAGYLQDIRLWDFINDNLESPAPYQDPTKQTAIGIWSIDKEYIQTYTEAIGNYFAELDYSKDFFFYKDILYGIAKQCF